MTLSRLSHRRPYLARVIPLKGGPLPSRKSGVFIAVFITDSESQPHVSDQLLQSLYGLTRAEIRFTKMLLRGLSIDEAIERLRVSRNTAKTHLSAIFQKTGTRRQSELIRLLLISTAILADPG